MPILPIPIPQNVLQMATAFTNAPPNSSIYFYKDVNGVVRSTNIENMTNDIGVGYPYQFINGDQIYTQLPVTNYNDIRFINPGSTTIPSLWNDKLKVWIDGSDKRTISSEKQKIISKSYGAMTYLIENTTDYNFQTGTDNIICSNNSNIETTNTLDVKPYWALAIIFKLDPLQTADNKLIFQHNRVTIKLTNNIAADGTTQLMIGLFDNSTFIQGLELSPNSSPLYYIFCDNSGNLDVNNVRCNQSKPTFDFFQTTTQKLYLSSINGQSNISTNLTLYELLYFTSDNNDCPTKTTVDTYLTNKHTNIDVYTPLHNTLPISQSWSWLIDSTSSLWSELPYPYNATYTSWVSSVCTVDDSDKSISFSSVPGGYTQYPISVLNRVNVSNAITNSLKYYFEFEITYTVNFWIGYMNDQADYSTWTAYNATQPANTAFYWYVLVGTANAQSYTTDNSPLTTSGQYYGYYGGSFPQMGANIPSSGTGRFGVGLEFSSNGSCTQRNYYNGVGIYSATIPANSCITKPAIGSIMPTIVNSHGGSNKYKYVDSQNATIPSGSIYIT